MHLVKPPYGHRVLAGLGYSMSRGSMDFETYSSAGYVWEGTKWGRLPGCLKYGLPEVGAAVYAQHPSTEVISLAYDLADGLGVRLWVPGMAAPQDLFDHIATGRELEAWNSPFEQWIWDEVCTRKMGWPALPPGQLFDVAAKARAFALPGKLENAAKVLGTAGKNAAGESLIRKFSMPRQPTKANPALRVFPSADPDAAGQFYAYNMQDVVAEDEIALRVPDLIPSEMEWWRIESACNRRGVHIDMRLVEGARAVLAQAYESADRRMRAITGGAVQSVSQLPALKAWLGMRGLVVGSLDAEALEALLKNDLLPPDVQEALRLREEAGSASVKKYHAIHRRATRGDRLHDMFIFHGARTGRESGADTQPQNLPNSGPSVYKCFCGAYYGLTVPLCPSCGIPPAEGADKVDWCPEAVECAAGIIYKGDLPLLEAWFGEGQALSILSSCLRGVFIPSEGYEFVSADFSAIEGVCAAMLAGETWREEVFRTHGKIYEMSASKISGVPFAEMMAHAGYHDLTIPRWWEAPMTGHHHPLRKTIGKIAELASGFGGWVGSWKSFGADEFFKDDDEIAEKCKEWRNASPAIVEMWGGQFRGYQEELYGLEGAFIRALMYPDQPQVVRGIKYLYVKADDNLYCTLLSGRVITYRRPRTAPHSTRRGLQLSFEGWNTNPKKGPYGWIRLETYGGQLFENVVQATARDILVNAAIKVTRIGYKLVLHVHDELVAEIEKGRGNLGEFTSAMLDLPEWCKDWPLRAAGWVGDRFQK